VLLCSMPMTTSMVLSCVNLVGEWGYMKALEDTFFACEMLCFSGNDSLVGGVAFIFILVIAV